MLFLIPLAIALLSIYIRYQSQEEIVAIFFTVLAGLSLLLSLVLAPWGVQILILLTGLWGIRQFCYHHSCQNAGAIRQRH